MRALSLGIPTACADPRYPLRSSLSSECICDPVLKDTTHARTHVIRSLRSTGPSRHYSQSVPERERRARVSEPLAPHSLCLVPPPTGTAELPHGAPRSLRYRMEALDAWVSEQEQAEEVPEMPLHPTLTR